MVLTRAGSASGSARSWAAMVWAARHRLPLVKILSRVSIAGALTQAAEAARWGHSASLIFVELDPEFWCLDGDVLAIAREPVLEGLDHFPSVLWWEG